MVVDLAVAHKYLFEVLNQLFALLLLVAVVVNWNQA
jgi:TnpA family transposase